jgi:hypothetical protein
MEVRCFEASRLCCNGRRINLNSGVCFASRVGGHSPRSAERELSRTAGSRAPMTPFRGRFISKKNAWVISIQSLMRRGRTQVHENIGIPGQANHRRGAECAEITQRNHWLFSEQRPVGQADL